MALPCPGVSVGQLFVALAVLATPASVLANSYCSDYKCETTVIGIAIYYFELNSINLAKGTYFTSYQLTIFEDKIKYPNFKAALDSVVDGEEHVSIIPTCKDNTNETRWLPWRKGKDELLFPNREEDEDGIDDNDHDIGRYLVKGEQHFSPNYEEYPSGKHKLIVRVELREETATSIITQLTGQRNSSLLFCEMTNYGMKNDKSFQKFSSNSDNLGVDDSVYVTTPTVCLPDHSSNCHKRFRASLDFGMADGKATSISSVPTILAAILASMSYFVPPSETSESRGIFLISAIIDLVASKASLDRNLPKAPEYTRGDYVMITGMTILLTAVMHYLMSMIFNALPKFNKEADQKHLYWASNAMGVAAVIFLFIPYGIIVHYVALESKVREHYLERLQDEQWSRKNLFWLITGLFLLLSLIIPPFVFLITFWITKGSRWPLKQSYDVTVTPGQGEISYRRRHP